MMLFDYFDRAAIIHLPERTDRLKALRKELSRVGRKDFSFLGIVIPEAPRPVDSNGFASKGVYGNFLSHLEIVESAYKDGLDRVLVLEDDAIFSRHFVRSQDRIIKALAASSWDLVFFGHSVRKNLPKSPTDLVQFRGDFIWAHCYGVNRSIMPRLIAYLKSTIEKEKMYIDGALTEFRRANDDAICLITSPCASVQRGSISSLSTIKSRGYAASAALSVARSGRDLLWRFGLLDIGPRRNAIPWIKVIHATPWDPAD